MRYELTLIELPIKSALKALAVFVASALVLSYMWETLAAAAFSMAASGASWDEVSAIAGLSIGRGTRYLVFYFFIFLAYASLLRSPLNSSIWSPLLKFAGLPTALSIIPALLSSKFAASGFWAAVAILIALISINAIPATQSKMVRAFFFLVILGLLTELVLSDVSQWGNAIYKVAVNLYGEKIANQRTEASFIYFAPGEIFRVAVNIYFFYFLPRGFFRELRKQIAEEQNGNLVHTNN